MQVDAAIIGSGFGGSVAALRLSEKGYRVCVIEQGNEVSQERMAKAARSVRALAWMPRLGMDGFFSQSVFRHLGVVGGVGVGGGSLVYAAVLLRPKDTFYQDRQWGGLGIDWKSELAPHYDRASRMLGVMPNPGLGTMDRYLQKTAGVMGTPETFGPTPMGIYFNRSGCKSNDPYFEGQGPARSSCGLCGECLTGCTRGAKNSLDKNYLFLARKKGATILPRRKVVNITPVSGERFQYRLTLADPITGEQIREQVTADKVILSAGVLGTLALLFHCRDRSRTLPRISGQLGKIVRTNSEAVVGALSKETSLDLSRGTTVSSSFYPDPSTHITQNRFPKGFNFHRWYFGPLVNHHRPMVRSIATLGRILGDPGLLARNWFARDWHRRMTVLTVMQDLDNQVSFEYGRSLCSLFTGYRLKTRAVKGKEAPTNLETANRAAEILARLSDSTPMNVIMESLGNLSFTAHILGGCHMGASREEGIIQTNHEVMGYPGLFIMDGSAISANVGVNPSLTITAMAERACALMPAHPSKT